MVKTFSIQEAREQDYATSLTFKKRTDARDLHMFFSPNIVPEGLTDEEVRICIELQKRREKLSEVLLNRKKAEANEKLKNQFQDDFFALENARDIARYGFGHSTSRATTEELAELFSTLHVVTYYTFPIPIPRELRQSPMTREGFEFGVRKLIDLMNKIERELS